MQKDEVIELNINSLGVNGEGIARHEDVVIFVPNALPGEIVSAKIVETKKNFARAKVVDILKLSKQRKEPPCPFYGECGGCDLQHLCYEKQLEFKRNLVRGNLRKIAKTEAQVSECVASESEYYYRNKVSFPISEKGIGMFEENSNNIVSIKNCFIVGEWAKTLIEVFNDWFAKSKILAYNRKTGKGILRHLVARCENNSLLVCIVATKMQDFGGLVAQIATKFSNFGLFVNINSSSTAKIFSEKFVHIAGIKQINQTSFGLNYPVSIGSFEQVNPSVAEKIYKHVCAEISGKVVVNAYSGAGLLSGILAKSAKKVIGIELDKNAHQNAEELKGRNKIANLTNICGDCAAELPKIHKFDAIVLDPPRAGCDKKVIETINAVAPKKIVYISCDSATLARDVSRLDGYKICSVTPYDMFPETHHVETVCVLVKNSI